MRFTLLHAAISQNPRLVAAFQQLINAILGMAPGPETPIEPRNDVCPHQGLQVFSEEDKEFFFGRDAETQRLVAGGAGVLSTRESAWP